MSNKNMERHKSSKGTLLAFFEKRKVRWKRKRGGERRRTRQEEGRGEGDPLHPLPPPPPSLTVECLTRIFSSSFEPPLLQDTSMFLRRIRADKRHRASVKCIHKVAIVQASGSFRAVEGIPFSSLRSDNVTHGRVRVLPIFLRENTCELRRATV